MICVLTGEKIASLTQGLISAKKQKGECSLDLTVRSISLIDTAGTLDFGGSEYAEASMQELIPEKRGPEEPYGWWKLKPGKYLIAYNESITPPSNAVIMIFPHQRLVAAGISHGNAAVDRLDTSIRILMNIGPEGGAIKENARISRALVVVSEPG
jgi:hypothetical protein